MVFINYKAYASDIFYLLKFALYESLSCVLTFPFWDLFAAQLHLFWGITTFWNCHLLDIFKILSQINIIWSSTIVSILNVPRILSESPVEQLNKMVHAYWDLPQIHQQILRPEFTDSIIQAAED